MLMPESAGRIVREVGRLLDEPIIITDVHGCIIAGTDASRIGTVHEGALQCSRGKQPIIIRNRDESGWSGVRAGISLPLLFRDEVVGVIGITGDPDRMKPYAELVRKMTELLIHEPYYLEQQEYEQRGYESLLIDWLQGGEWAASFADRARALGIDLRRPKRLAIVSIELEDGFQLPRSLWRSLRSLLPKDTLLARWGSDRFVLVWSETTRGTARSGDETASRRSPSSELKPERIREECERRIPGLVRVQIGIGKAAAAEQLPRSYEQASRAVELAQHYGGIAYYEQLGLEMCLQEVSPQTRQDYVARTIGPLLEHPELVETLRVLIDENASYKTAAERLHIHINSLHYRLRRIGEYTGLDPKTFADLAELHIALKLLVKPTKI